MRDTVEVLMEEERLKGIMGGKPKMTRLSEGLSNQTAHQERVEQFMCEARQVVLNVPTMPDAKIRKLRASLILEEALKTIQALGMNPYVRDVINHGLIPIEPRDEIVWTTDPQQISIVAVANGCADLSVVTIGTLSACGIFDKPILEIVDQNNLKKFGPGHSFHENGKLVKPKGHTPPTADIIQELERQTCPEVYQALDRESEKCTNSAKPS